MKKFLTIFTLLLFAIWFNSCVEAESMNNGNGNNNETGSSDLIKISFSGNTITVRLQDSNVAKEFLTMLPLSLTFTDYVGKEKIATLPKKLQATANGHKPEIGDFTYYAPWGNIAYFYGSNSYSGDLILLGRTESGVDKIKLLSNGSKVLIEKAN